MGLFIIQQQFRNYTKWTVSKCIQGSHVINIEESNAKFTYYFQEQRQQRKKNSSYVSKNWEVGKNYFSKNVLLILCLSVLPACLPMIAEVLELELQMAGELPRGYWNQIFLNHWTTTPAFLPKGNSYSCIYTSNTTTWESEKLIRKNGEKVHYIYVFAHMYSSTGRHMPQCLGRGQRTTGVAGSLFPPCGS